MIEEWKIIKEWNGVTTSASTHCTGDKLYVSNTGKVRLNDIELTLDKGLYINKGYEICIVGTSWPFRNMHRTIYQLFTGKLKKGCGWNIHHIDRNHYNNEITNLVQLTAFEHGKLHTEQGDMNRGPLYNSEWLNEQLNKADDVIELTNRWYKDRVKDYLNKQKEISKSNSIVRDNQRKQKQLDKQQIKQQEIEEKLASGDYYYDKAGVLRPKHRRDKGRKHSKEWGDKISVALSKACEDGTFKIANKGKKRYFNSETNKFYYK